MEPSSDVFGAANAEHGGSSGHAPEATSDPAPSNTAETEPGNVASLPVPTTFTYVLTDPPRYRKIGSVEGSPLLHAFTENEWRLIISKIHAYDQYWTPV